MTRHWRAVALAAILCVHARSAAADWLLTAIAGTTVRGATGFFDLDATAGDPHPIYGVSVMRFPGGLLGVDGEMTIAPSFFTGHQLVESSRVLAGSVSALMTVPRRLLSSVRPYVVVGVGFVSASSSDVRSIFPIDSTLPAFDAGAGVLVPISRRLAVRADGRFVRTSNSGDGALSAGNGFLEMWRLAAGVSWSLSTNR